MVFSITVWHVSSSCAGYRVTSRLQGAVAGSRRRGPSSGCSWRAGTLSLTSVLPADPSTRYVSPYLHTKRLQPSLPAVVRLPIPYCLGNLRLYVTAPRHIRHFGVYPQGLAIQCDMHPAAVCQLPRLPRLRHLHLTLPLGHGTDTWTAASGAMVATAIMPVILGAPRLKQLVLEPRSDARFDPASGHWVPCSQPAGRELVEALQGGVQWVKGELGRLGRDPDVVWVSPARRSLMEDFGS